MPLIVTLLYLPLRTPSTGAETGTIFPQILPKKPHIEEGMRRRPSPKSKM
jgi:hypothetical protein